MEKPFVCRAKKARDSEKDQVILMLSRAWYVF